MKRLNDLESYWMPFTANRDFKKDPRMVVAAAPLEDRFWNKFCKAIELPNKFINMQNNQQIVIKEIRKIIALNDKNYWSEVFNKADCCCSIVKSRQITLAEKFIKSI